MNVPHIISWKDNANRVWVIVLTSARKLDDGFDGTHWRLVDPNGDTCSGGESRGVGGQLLGSAIMAEKNARAAARRAAKRFKSS